MSFPGNTLWHFCCLLNSGTVGSGWMWSCVFLSIGVCLAGKFPGSAGNLGLLLFALMSKGTCWDPCWKLHTLKHGSMMKCSWEKLQTSRITGAVLNLLKIPSNAGRLQLLCGNCISAVGGVSCGTEMSFWRGSQANIWTSFCHCLFFL